MINNDMSEATRPLRRHQAGPDLTDGLWSELHDIHHLRRHEPKQVITAVRYPSCLRSVVSGIFAGPTPRVSLAISTTATARSSKTVSAPPQWQSPAASPAARLPSLRPADPVRHGGPLRPVRRQAAKRASPASSDGQRAHDSSADYPTSDQRGAAIRTHLGWTVATRSKGISHAPSPQRPG